jgi:hypothetical protein
LAHYVLFRSAELRRYPWPGGFRGTARTMNLATRQRIAALAKKVAKLVLIEALVPGGTLVVLTILLAGGRLPSLAEWLAARVPVTRWGKFLQLGKTAGISVSLGRIQ